MKQLFVVIGALTLMTVAGASTVLAQDAPAAATDIVGTWDVTTVSPQGEQTNTMVVSKEGDALKAVAKSDLGEAPYDKVTATGNKVTIVLTIDFQGSPMIITYTGTSDGKKMDGTCDFGGLADGTWSAVRK